MVFVLYLYVLNLYLQKLPTSGHLIKENYNDLVRGFDLNNRVNIELSRHNKQEYTKYFIEKMELINMLKTFTYFEIQYVSYYCYVCDIVLDTEQSWDKHFKMCHADSIAPNIYCSSCCLYIFGCDIKDHCWTTEHCDLLKILNNLNSAIAIKSVVRDQDEVPTYDDEVPTYDVEDPQPMLNNTSETNGN